MGNQEDDTTVHDGVCGEPVIPKREQARLIIVNLVIAILAITHGIGLQHKVSQCMAKTSKKRVSINGMSGSSAKFVLPCQI